ncbi:MAG: cytochrome c oxidase subunit II [Bacteroidota bacterium]
MNTTIKNIFKLALASAIIFFTATLASDSINIDSLMQDGYSAEKPWFGTDEYNYEAPKEVSPTDAIASKIKWSILVLVVLLVLVLANAFDISSLTSKITGKETINSNNINKWMMLIFMIVGMICVGWEYVEHGKLILLGNASSEHGAIYDSMFTITLILTTIVFVITQVALFYFAFRYAKKDGQKALYYSHNNKLEVFWTIIPAIVLTILVLRGHQTWRSIVYADEDGTKSTNIEIFAEQFAWSARYAGEDGKLGKVDYKFISGTNKLGLAYQPAVDTLLVELAKAIKADEKAIAELLTITLPTLKNVDLPAANSMKDYNAIKNIEKEIEFIESGDKLDELNESIDRKKTQIKRIIAIKNNPTIFASTFTNAEEDDIITQELHLVKDKMVTFRFRSRDIIHSAWLPHFRVQMNVVPGMPTKFTFIPTKTTKEAKAENGQDFEYYLYCNKICGASHYNMKMKVVIESQEEVDAWLKSQKPAFKAAPVVEVVPVAVPAQDSSKINNTDSIKTKLAQK